MFTGRFHVHSVRAKESVQKKRKKDSIKKITTIRDNAVLRIERLYLLVGTIFLNNLLIYIPAKRNIKKLTNGLINAHMTETPVNMPKRIKPIKI